MNLNGTWIMGEVSKDFAKILRILGYSSLQRKYLKATKTLIHSTIEDNVLTIDIESPLYKQSKKYLLNNTPIEYEDEWKQQVLEISKWVNDTTIEVKTLYVEKNITVVDTREILSEDECRHHVSLMSPTEEHPINVEMIYKRKKGDLPEPTVDDVDDEEAAKEGSGWFSYFSKKK